MQKVYLSRRNLQTLLNKLDRNVAAQDKESACTLVKKDTMHPVYPCSDVIEVIALEDNEYYTDRVPGRVHEADVPRVRVEYRVQVQSLKTGEWRDSINGGVDNPYASFYEAAAVAAKQEKDGCGLKYRAAITVAPPAPKEYLLEYFSYIDRKWCRSTNFDKANPFNTRAEAREALVNSRSESSTGLQYRIVEVDS
jgi:hypothetical protein